MKNKLKLLIVPIILLLVPVIIGLFLWNRLPDSIPSHFNLSGEADRYSSKAMMVFGLPAIMLFAELACFFVTCYDPKRKNISSKMFMFILYIIPIITIVMSAISYARALGNNIRVETVLPLILGLVFIIIGNYLPKCRQNYTVGIKLPWTLNDENNWNKTHRFGGICFIIGGLFMAVGGFIGNKIMMFAPIFIAVTAPTIYSFLLYKKSLKDKSGE